MNSRLQILETPSKILGLAVTILLLAVTFSIYQPGLSGPLLLDDDINLKDISRYFEGDKTATAVITDNRSGRLGRPVSMASFILDAQLWGNSTWHAKRTNLVIHLGCGILVLLLFWSLLHRTPQLKKNAAKIALLLVAVWLLLPLHVSTVLYLVQRMALLSAFFMLAGLVTFVLAREGIERRNRWGTLVLWIGVPSFTLIGAFSKENALLTPLLALIIEIVWFRPKEGGNRPKTVFLFFLLFLAIPMLFSAILLANNPASFIDYTYRDFTLYERLLTQTRVLCDYVLAALLPRPSDLGLFQDYYPISSGPLSPPTTLLAIVAWLCIVITAWRWRTRIPAYSGGIGFFLAAHSMESGIFPLEIYFEHRNYLPSIGLLLAITGLVGELISRLPAPTRSFWVTSVCLAVLAPTTMAAITLGRVQAWSTTSSFYAQQLKHHSQSPRLHSFLLGFALNNSDFPAAMAHIEAAERAFNRPNMRAPTYWRFLAYCSVNEPPPDRLYDELDEERYSRIDTVEMLSWEALAEKIEAEDCPGIDADPLIDFVDGWVDNTKLSPKALNVWRSRYSLARVLASKGNLDRAAKVGSRAWEDSNFNRGIGIFLFQIYASLGNEEKCRYILSILERSEGQGHVRFDNAVQTFREGLSSGLD